MAGGFRRWAIYYAPADHDPLARFGAEWLGWDARSGRICDRPDPPRLPQPREGLTCGPDRYGFHATLKAPFVMAAGCGGRERLEATCAELAAGIAPFDLSLTLGSLGEFLALVPAEPVPALEALAEACVVRLDRFRDAAPGRTTPRAGLSPREADHLARWGYPFVLDAFRFHMTLTVALAPDARERVQALLVQHLRPLLAEAREVRDICLFGEDEQEYFHLLRRFPFAGTSGAT